MRSDIPSVDSELMQLVAHVRPERIGAHLRYAGSCVAEPRGCHRHVGGAPADRFLEPLGTLERCARLISVEVDADASDCQQLEVCHGTISSAASGTRDSISCAS